MGQFEFVKQTLAHHYIGKARHKGHEMFAPFKIGDIVRLRSGSSPIQVVEVEYFEKPPNYIRFKIPNYKYFIPGWYVKHEYLSTLKYTDYNDATSKWRIAEDFVQFDYFIPEEETRMTLYQTKDGRFGTLLTKNSKGQFVLEMKGKDGEVETFYPKDVEEVMPYTVRLRRFSGGTETAQNDYEMVEGTVSVGDILIQLSNGSVWEVTFIDTKCRNPSQSKNGFFKLEGKRL